MVKENDLIKKEMKMKVKMNLSKDKKIINSNNLSTNASVSKNNAEMINANVLG
jgi:hypothetical protein